MQYFLVETDVHNHIPYSINRKRVIDIRYANRENAYKIPDCSIVDMQLPMECFFPDLLTSPLLLVSRVFADVIEMYMPGTLFKMVYLLEYESEEHAVYYIPFLEEVDCLAEETVKSRGGTELIKIVLDKKKILQKPVFRVAGYTHSYLICRLDVVESVLMRHRLKKNI